MPSAPKRVSDTVLGSLNLASEPLAVPGRQFRLRRLEIAPGGVVPFHRHHNRPAIIYLAAGEITEDHSTCRLPITHRAGDAIPENAPVSHHWVNNSSLPARVISAGLFADDSDAGVM